MNLGKTIFSLCLFFLICIYCCYAQTETNFNILEVVVQNDFEAVKGEFLKHDTLAFFEDENYFVRKSCSGAWGGSIYFKSKQTGIEYACRATCPVIVNKIKDTYYVTNTLAHLEGFSEIIIIENPVLLNRYRVPRRPHGRPTVLTMNQIEVQSAKGCKRLLDSLGVLTLVTFVFKNELFHIVTDLNTTFIAKVVKGRFVNLGMISNKSLWTYNPEVLKTKSEHLMVFFNNNEVKGYLDVFENNILVAILE